MERRDKIRQALELEHRSRAEFWKAHQAGVDGLERRDFQALTDAVSDEASAIEKHRDALRQLNEIFRRRD